MESEVEIYKKIIGKMGLWKSRYMIL